MNMNFLKNYLVFLSTIFLTVSGLMTVFANKTQAVTEYYVQPYIIVPYDWRNCERVSPDNMERMKKIIEYGLADIQSWYKEVVPGKKTFKYKSDVKVFVHTDPQASLPKFLPIDNKNECRTESIIYLELQAKFGNEIFIPRKKIIPENLLKQIPENEIPVFWIIGTLSQLSSISVYDFFGKGGSAYVPDEERIIIVMPWDLLESLSPDYPTPAIHEFARKALAHELGHAFGLVHAGWANDHPCTEVSKEKECQKNAPTPLPGPEEWNTVMGYGLIYIQGGFNNSGYNPELWKLYQSPWINPEGDPVPDGVTLPKQVPRKQAPPEITNVSPQIVDLGGELEIHGKNFGNITGTVKLYQKGEEVGLAKILSWSDKLVKIKVEQPADAFCLTTASQGSQDGQTTCSYIFVREPKTGPGFLTINTSATCGVENKPLEGITISLNQVLEVGSGTETIIQWQTGEDGKAQFYLPMLEKRKGYSVEPGEYEVAPQIIKELPLPLPTSANFEITEQMVQAKKDIEKEFAFHYPKCPGETAAPTTTPTPPTTPTPTPKLPFSYPTEACSPGNLGEFLRQCIGDSGCLYRVFQCDENGNWQYLRNEVNCDFAPPECNTPLQTPEEQATEAGTLPTPPTPETETGKPDIGGPPSIPTTTATPTPTPAPKTISSIIIFDRSLPLDGSEITLSLPGIREGEAGIANVPIEVHYSDGSTRTIVMKFEYQPVAAEGTCQVSFNPGDAYSQCGGQCNGVTFDPSRTVFVKVKRDSSGNVCGYECKDLGRRPGECGNPQTLPSPTIGQPTPTPAQPTSAPAPTQTPTPPTPPVTPTSPQVTNWCVRKECDTAIGKMVCIIQYSDGTEKVGEATDKSCTASCQPPYPQCAGTVGLEDPNRFPPGHTIWVIPVCDTQGNIVEYQHKDLGNLGQCEQ